MKKLKLLFTIVGLLLLSISIPVSGFAQGGNDSLIYWYKGSFPDKKYRGCLTSNCSYTHTNNEWTTVTVHQFYDPSVDRGRAKVRGFARTTSVLREFPGHYAKVEWISVALRENDSRGFMEISNMDPVESSSNTNIGKWAHFLSGYLPERLNIATNAMTSGIEYWSGGLNNKRIKAFNTFGLNLAKVDVPNNVIHSGVEQWANDRFRTQNIESGFTGLFVYHIHKRQKYGLEAWSQTTYVVSESNFLYSFPAHSGYAYVPHFVYE